MQVFSRRSISQLGDRTVDCEDLEPVGSGSSSDNEVLPDFNSFIMLYLAEFLNFV